MFGQAGNPLDQLPIDPSNIPTSAPAPDQVQDVLRRLNDAVGNVQPPDVPDLPTFLDQLQGLPVGAAIVLLVVGALYLLTGLRLFRLIISLSAGCVGAVVGGMIAVQMGYEPQWWIGALVGGGLLAILAWPLMKAFICLFGGVVGGSFGYVAFQQIVASAGRPEWAQHAWVGAVVGALLLGILAVAVFRVAIMVFTSLQGAGMLFAGVVALFLKTDAVGPPLRSHILENPLLTFFAVLGVGLIGMAMQLSHWMGLRKAEAAKEEKKD